MLCDKGYDGSSPAHCASDLYPVKVDDPQILQSKNLPSYPHRNMGLQWKLGHDRRKHEVTATQEEMFQVSTFRGRTVNSLSHVHCLVLLSIDGGRSV